MFYESTPPLTYSAPSSMAFTWEHLHMLTAEAWTHSVPRVNHASAKPSFFSVSNAGITSSAVHRSRFCLRSPSLPYSIVNSRAKSNEPVASGHKSLQDVVWTTANNDTGNHQECIDGVFGTSTIAYHYLTHFSLTTVVSGPPNCT